MRNFIQTGDNITLPAPYNVASGEGVLIGSLFGVASTAAGTGEETSFVTRGVFELPKVAALAISPGDKLYWNATDKVVTKTASGNSKIGAAVAAAAGPDGTVKARLDGVAI